MTEPIEDEKADNKQMKLRYAGVCRLCRRNIPARNLVIYERSPKTVRCLECLAEVSLSNEASPETTIVSDALAPVDVIDDRGVAGSSARREYAHRKAKDEEHLRQWWGKLAGIAVALTDEKLGKAPPLAPGSGSLPLRIRGGLLLDSRQPCRC